MHTRLLEILQHPGCQDLGTFVSKSNCNFLEGEGEGAEEDLLGVGIYKSKFWANNLHDTPKDIALLGRALCISGAESVAVLGLCLCLCNCQDLGCILSGR